MSKIKNSFQFGLSWFILGEHETKNCIYLEVGEWIPRVKVNDNEKWVKHVYLPWSRQHVLSWSLGFDGKSRVHCSETDCIVNKDHRTVV